MIQLKQKNALITGGSRGVGRATAKMLAGVGANVGFTWASNQTAAEETLSELQAVQGNAWMHQADFGDTASIAALFAEVDGHFQDGLDIFIANAGIWPSADIDFAQMPAGHWQRTLEINLHSVIACTQAALKRIRNHGRIVFVGSTAGQVGEARHADYATSKAALSGFTKSLCQELGPRGITVNTVAPGWIDTDMAAPVMTADYRQAEEAGIPLQRIATADDIAGPIVFLCSDLARHITGEVLNVNGGLVRVG